MGIQRNFCSDTKDWDWVELEPEDGSDNSNYECYVIDALSIKNVKRSTKSKVGFFEMFSFKEGLQNTVHTSIGILTKISTATRPKTEQLPYYLFVHGYYATQKVCPPHWYIEFNKIMSLNSNRTESFLMELFDSKFTSILVQIRVRCRLLIRFIVLSKREIDSMPQIMVVKHTMFIGIGDNVSGTNQQNYSSGWSLKVKSRRIQKSDGLFTFKKRSENNEFIPRILSDIHGLSEEQLMPFGILSRHYIESFVRVLMVAFNSQ